MNHNKEQDTLIVPAEFQKFVDMLASEGTASINKTEFIDGKLIQYRTYIHNVMLQKIIEALGNYEYVFHIQAEFLTNEFKIQIWKMEQMTF